MRLFLFFGLLFWLQSVVCWGQNSPRLVVIINVDELHTEHLQILGKKFGRFGFNQLIDKGTYYNNAHYSCTSSYNGTRLVNLCTGTTPSTHGIISDWWYNAYSKDEQKAYEYNANKDLSDSATISIKLAEVLASTFADQLFLINKNKSKVACVGFSAEDYAFFSHQRSAKRYWFNSKTGLFTSSDSTHIPNWVSTFNNMKFPALYSSKQWGPIADLKQYQEYITNGNHPERNFLYDLSSNTGAPYGKLAQSPYANVIIRDFAASLLLHENYGKDNFTDILSLSFTCKPFTSKNQELFDAEVEDMLLRLDEQIESLVNVVKDNIGLEQTLFVLTSTPTSHFQAETLLENNISTGVFDGKKTSALLNLYLMAIYGQGKWVKGYHDKQFYLNHELIKESKIDFNEILNKSSEFLLEVSGIMETVSAKDIRTQEYNHGFFSLVQKSYFYGRSGDLFISLKPGWLEKDLSSNSYSTIGTKFNIPLIFFGWKTYGEQIFNPTPMENVASTICAILNIPPPNGNIGTPLNDVVKLMNKK